MAAAVTVRAGVAADAPALAGIQAAARATALPGLREAHDGDTVATWRATHLMARRTARAAPPPIDQIGVGRDPAHDPKVMHRDPDAACRTHGIRLPMLAEAMAALGPRLSLFCVARNTGARAFYERHGFRVAATSDAADTEDREPDIPLARDDSPSTQTSR